MLLQNRNIILLFLWLGCVSIHLSQSDSMLMFRNRKIGVNMAIGMAYTGSLVYLNQIWYKPYHHAPFHFFNDNNEWFLMDKYGHAFTSYYATNYLNQLYRWAGYKNPQWIATGISYSYLLTIEIMDGYSSGWGFSWGDIGANTLGVGLFLLNTYYLENFFHFKFSFYPTTYAAYNPTLLGTHIMEQIIKDYNGQTYWISISPFYKWKPSLEWLCMSFGYGIDGCIGAVSNQYYRQSQYFDYSYIPRFTQWYLSIDIDASKIKTKRKWLQHILKSINWIKIPSPAIEFKGNNVYFRPLIFSN